MADSDDRDDRWIHGEEWATVVRNVPIVSVDLVVRIDGGVLLGRRENEPARGEWFVPGGTVFKNERETEAVRRVARTELGCEVELLDRLGSFEQFYETSDVDGVDTKHYLAQAFVVRPTEGSSVDPDDQHSELAVFEPPFDDVDLHPYVARYVERIAFE